MNKYTFVPEMTIDSISDTTVTLTTEEKILDAARRVFTAKGYAGTKTRDIAKEAGINLALLNYYFRSKEKLFSLIMEEKLKQMFGRVIQIIRDDSTTVDQKTELLVSNYIDMLSANPDLPIFVLSEIRNNPEHMMGQMMQQNPFSDSSFLKQLSAERPEISPVQLLMSIMGMTIFPFLAKPILMKIGNLDPSGYQDLMNERKTLIKQWMRFILDHPVHTSTPS